MDSEGTEHSSQAVEKLTHGTWQEVVSSLQGLPCVICDCKGGNWGTKHVVECWSQSPAGMLCGSHSPRRPPPSWSQLGYRWDWQEDGMQDTLYNHLLLRTVTKGKQDFCQLNPNALTVKSISSHCHLIAHTPSNFTRNCKQPTAPHPSAGILKHVLGWWPSVRLQRVCGSRGFFLLITKDQEWWVPVLLVQAGSSSSNYRLSNSIFPVNSLNGSHKAD